MLSLTKYKDIKLFIFHYCFAAGIGRLTKHRVIKAEIRHAALTGQLINTAIALQE